MKVLSSTPDNSYYDIINNPCYYMHNDFVKSHAIYDSGFAILENNTLTVLQNDTIAVITILDGAIIQHIMFDCFGCNYRIYKPKRESIIYGEIKIKMLDFNLIK